MRFLLDGVGDGSTVTCQTVRCRGRNQDGWNIYALFGLIKEWWQFLSNLCLHLIGVEVLKSVVTKLRLQHVTYFLLMLCSGLDDDIDKHVIENFTQFNSTRKSNLFGHFWWEISYLRLLNKPTLILLLWIRIILSCAFEFFF